MRKLLVLIPVFLFGIYSCEKDKVPAFLKVNEFTISANPNLNGTEGELTSNITSVWAYADGEALGVYDLPCEIPVLKEGNAKIQLIPGVKYNGISATKGRYTMYKSFDVNLDLEPNKTYELNPTTQYADGLTFRNEDFESFTNVFTEFDNSPASIVNSAEGAVYGDKCGKVVLNAIDSTWNAKTNWNVNLPKNRPVFLEIDYKIENNILISTEAGNSTGTNVSPYVELNSSTSNDTWKKIYISLQENVSYEVNATFYNIVLTSVLPDDVEEATLLIDNVKLVYAL